MTSRWRVALALLCAVATPAAGSGINLRWTNCVADNGTRSMAFACDTNTGSRTFVTSFVLTNPLPGSNSVSATIDVFAADVSLPAWWDFRNCRSGSLRLLQSAVGPVNCEMAEGFSGGGINFYELGVNGPNSARLQCVTGAPAHDLVAAREYIGPVLTANFNRTVGTPSCSGCDVGVCLVLNQLTLASAVGPPLVLTQPELPPDSHVATWQGVGLSPAGNCQAATPTRRTLWGEVKALYR